jgi:hypothetical protein
VGRKEVDWLESIGCGQGAASLQLQRRGRRASAMEEIDGYYVLCDGEVQVGAGLLQMKLGSLLPPAKRCLPQIGTLRPPNRSLLCCVTNKCDSHQFSAERGEGALAT